MIWTLACLGCGCSLGGDEAEPAPPHLLLHVALESPQRGASRAHLVQGLGRYKVKGWGPWAAQVPRCQPGLEGCHSSVQAQLQGLQLCS